MEESHFREQADRCRRLARDSTDPVLQVSLRRLADEYQMRADEIENDEISAKMPTRTIDSGKILDALLPP